MAKDERDVVELLKTELDFIEKGGYGRSVRTPWKETSPLRDLLTCVNYALPEKAHPCSQCHLIVIVAAVNRDEQVPCHFIPRTETGEADVEVKIIGNEERMDTALKEWACSKSQGLGT